MRKRENIGVYTGVSEVYDARVFVRQYVEKHSSVDDEDIDNLILCVSEVHANVINHAHREKVVVLLEGEDSNVTVYVFPFDERDPAWVLSIDWDSEPEEEWAVRHQVKLPPHEQFNSGGRGLFIVHYFCERRQILGVTRLRLRPKELNPARSHASCHS